MSAATRIATAAERIRSAFADVPYPGDDDIGQRVLGSRSYNCLESRNVAEFFAGRAWAEINWDVLWHEYDGQASACTSFMTHAAFRYYLPAYMLMALQGIDVVDTLATSVVQDLIPGMFPDSGGADDDGRFGRNIRALTLSQRAAVALFLLAMQEAYGPDLTFDEEDSPLRGLRDYWGQFLAEEDRHLIEHMLTT
ncbi:MAG: DUF6714 family protein [Janthinobacterium lividum]